MKKNNPITLRLPEELLEELLEQADALVKIIGAKGDLAATHVTRSTVIRIALVRGMTALRAEFGPGAAPSKTKRSSRKWSEGHDDGATR